MPIGKVKWFDIKKGFGFIQDEDGQDIFVHFSVIEGGGFRRLVDNEEVEYELSRGPKGLLAANVRRLESDVQKAGDNDDGSGSVTLKSDQEAQKPRPDGTK